VADEQHTVTGGNTKQRDETDNRRNTYFTRGNHQGEDPTNQGQRQVDENHPTLSGILELHVEQEEDDHDTHQRSQQQGLAGGLFAFELTTVFHVITFRQLHFGFDAFLYIVYYPTKVTSTGIGGDNNLTFYVFTAHGIRSHGRNHIGHITDRNTFTAWGIYHQITHLVHFITGIVLGTDDEVEYLALFVNLRYYGTRQVHFHKFGKFRHGYTILRHHFTFRNKLKLRTFDLLLYIEVGNTFHSGDSRLDAVGVEIQVVQVITKELDGNARLGTRKHGIDTVANRLTKFDVGTRKGIQLVTNFLHHFFLRAVLQFVRCFDFASVYPTRVFIQFGTTGLASHGLDFRNGEQEFFRTTTELVGFFERYAWHRGDVNGQ